MQGARIAMGLARENACSAEVYSLLEKKLSYAQMSAEKKAGRKHLKIVSSVVKNLAQLIGFLVRIAHETVKQNLRSALLVNSKEGLDLRFFAQKIMVVGFAALNS